jgi:hypothetical protein
MALRSARASRGTNDPVAPPQSQLADDTGRDVHVGIGAPQSAHAQERVSIGRDLDDPF